MRKSYQFVNQLETEPAIEKLTNSNKWQRIELKTLKFRQKGYGLNGLRLKLLGLLAIAALLRFWNLDSKALWLDEWLTAFVALGYGSPNLPLEHFFTPEQLYAITQTQASGAMESTAIASLAQSLNILQTESTHPPLFFILMHLWLRFWGSLFGAGGLGVFGSPDFAQNLGQNFTQHPTQHFAWTLRSLPALLGVAQVAALFWCGRVGFSARIGWVAAAIGAVSPFCVYLSQEARHYTLLMLCITLSLGGLLGTLKTLRLGQLEELQKLQELGKLEASKQSGHDGRSGQLEQSRQLEHPNLHRSPSKMPAHRTRPKLNRSVCWIWLVSNAIGLYSHYFFVLVLAVEGMIVLGWLVRWRFGFSHGDQLWRSPRSAWLKPWRTLWHTSWITPLGVPIVLFLPWALQLIAHINRAETNWSKPFDPSWSDRFAPIVQTLIGWVSLLVALPIHANLLIQVVGGGLGLLAAGVLSRWLLRSLHQRREPEAAIVVSYIGLFIGVMWLLAYGFGKDMTIVPRYHAVYYPALCLWLALAVEPTSLSSFSLRSELFELWHGLKRVYRRTFQGVPLNRLEHLQSCQSWQQWGRSCRLQPIAWVLLISLLGSSLVTHNLAFPKPYTPREFAQRLLRVDSGSVDSGRVKSGRVKSGRSARSAELAGLAGSAQFIAPPALPSAKTQTPAAETGKLLTAPTVVIGYENLQEIALGWSILWEVANQALTPDHFPEHSPATLPQFALLDRTSGYAQLWQRLSELAPLPRSSPVGDLWVIAPGLRQAEFPATLTILRSSSHTLLNQALLNQAPIDQTRPTQNPPTQATSTAYPCTQADDRYGRLGIPFQGYRCSS